MLVGIIVGSILGFILILFFILLLGLYIFTFYSPKKGQSDDFNLEAPLYEGHRDEVIPLIEGIKKEPYEDVYIDSFDKLRLHARLYDQKSDTVAILCHGYRGTAYRDFSGGAREVLHLGYNVILNDERAHGASKGHSITFGIRETKDVIKWVEYARNRFGKDIKIVLIGISMGGATVLMCADKIEGDVKIIADCPFSAPNIMLKETIKSMRLSPSFFYPILNLSALIFTHTNMNKLSAYDAVNNTNHPILIIHGDHDQVVPHHISEDLYKKHPDKIQYELFPGANHGMSYLVDKPRYQQLIKDFLSH